jgi:integrase
MPYGEKAEMPISLGRHLTGEPFVVSKYGDQVWDFYPYIPQENLKPAQKLIKWSVSLPDGRKLTDPYHATLLESTKDFIWSLFSSPVEGQKRSSMATLIAKFELVQPLLRWMVSNRLSRFCDLAGRTLGYVPVARLSSDGKRFVSDTTLHYRLHILEYLYLQQGKLRDALHVHPWLHETALSLSGKKRGGDHRKPTTEIIPDHIAKSLGSVALEYVRELSSDIFSALDALETAAKKLGNARPQAITDARTQAAIEAGFDGVYSLRKKAIHLRTACYIVIDMFSGIRDSEMMSLGLSCISRSRSQDDTMEILWLFGTIYKTGMRAKKWIVPPVVEEAILVLTRLTSGLRERMELEAEALKNELICSSPMDVNRKSKRLHELISQKNRLFLASSTKFGNSVSVLSGTQINQDLKAFCRAHKIFDEGTSPYRLHAHQFRRTYAQFLARAELGDLLFLRDHFGHWSLDMTLYYVDGAADGYEADMELIGMVSTEKMERQKEILGTHLKSDLPLANGAHWLKSWRKSIRTAVNKEALIEEFAGTVTLNGTGHSWCVGNAKGMGCGGLCIFEAQKCVDCRYGIIGAEHRPVWIGIREQQLEALALNDMGPGGNARAIEILGFAETVIRRLDSKDSE